MIQITKKEKWEVVSVYISIASCILDQATERKLTKLSMLLLKFCESLLYFPTTKIYLHNLNIKSRHERLIFDWLPRHLAFYIFLNITKSPSALKLQILKERVQQQTMSIISVDH
mgnify:CR=1 FL=1